MDKLPSFVFQWLFFIYVICTHIRFLPTQYLKYKLPIFFSIFCVLENKRFPKISTEISLNDLQRSKEEYILYHIDKN